MEIIIFDLGLSIHIGTAFLPTSLPTCEASLKSIHVLLLTSTYMICHTHKHAKEYTTHKNSI